MNKQATASLRDPENGSRAVWAVANWRTPEAWDQMYARLVEFYRQHGHTCVPKDYALDRELSRWVRRQAYLGRNGQLWREWESRLTALGFEFNIQVIDSSDAMHTQLAAFQAKHGRTRLKALFTDNRSAASWVQRQQWLAAHGKLPAVCRKRLEQLGVDLHVPQPGPDKLWEKMYDRLDAFRHQHGHARVPPEFDDDQKLGRWVSTQRSLAKRGYLLPERRERLEQLGFDFKRQKCPDWEDGFARLAAFHALHGHLRVSAREGADRQLARWMARQRRHAALGRLTPERRARLEKLEFDFTITMGAKWAEAYARVVAFVARQGHGRVSAGYGADRRLANWATMQRRLAAAGKLRPERRAQLEQIGFAFVIRRR